MFSIHELLSITRGKASQLACPTDIIRHLLIDSRKVVFAETSLFFAIKGERHDGHLFIHEMIKKGVRNFIITSNEFLQTHEANFILVDDAIEALQKTAAAHRARFSYPVIGITGSNGKTIVKEWLYQLLSPDFNIVRSPKSYNSQVGVPLSVWEMNEHHNLAIFEAGISQVGEMQNLECIIQPTIGIFTNIGSAHDEGFENISQKINEKALLFKNCTHIYSVNSERISPTLPEKWFLSCLVLPLPTPKKGGRTRLYWGKLWGKYSPPPFLGRAEGGKGKRSRAKNNITQNFQILCSTQQADSTFFELAYQDQPFSLNIHYIDEATIENALTCLCVLLHFEVPLSEIQGRFDRLRPVAMRLELKEAINNSYLIDDSYNNDLSGLKIALNFLKLQKRASKKILVLSDMHETNLPDAELYSTIADILKMVQADELIGIGEKMCQFQAVFNAYQPQHFFQSTEDFLTSSVSDSLHNALILVKGARSFAFENIVKKLQKKAHGTILEINLDALTHNLNFYKSLLKPATKVMAMVKAFAYGSGSAEVAQWLQFHHVDYLGVAYIDEGVFLRKNGITLPIMVLNPTVDSFEQCVAYRLEPEIYNFSLLEALNALACPLKIHIKLDTGMHRLGFEPAEIPRLVAFLADKLPSTVRVASVLSHMAGADEEKHTDFSQKQIRLFEQETAVLEEALGYSFLRHIANSPTITRFPEAHFDMVRLGIGLHGIETSQLYSSSLMPVATFKTIISQVKNIPKGETVGYGRHGVAEQDTRIATIAVGYADGFLRRLGKGVGKVGIHGKLAPVIGNVCMDMAMVDITHINAKEGDEVVIFGENPTVFDLADALQTIPYEVLTLVSERVKRVFFTE